jgi:hypothetical protein
VTQTSDQWKQGGDCSICRRKEYCRKACRQHHLWYQRAIAQIMAKSKAGRMLSAMKRTMHDAGHEMEYMYDG